MSTKYSSQNTHSTKIFPWPTKKNSMSKQNFSMTNKNFRVQRISFHVQQKISCPKIFYVQPKNPTSNVQKSYHHKIFFHTQTHKNFHTHEIRHTHSNKISALIKNKFVQSSLHIKSSWFQYPQNSNQNSFINTTS